MTIPGRRGVVRRPAGIGLAAEPHAPHEGATRKWAPG